MSKEANTVKPNRRIRGRVLSVAISGSALLLIVVVLLGVVFIAIQPIYPKITGTIQTQLAEPRFSLSSPKLDRLTLAQASNIAKGEVFLYQGPPSIPETKFTLLIQVYYGTDKIAEQSFADIQTGQYYFSVVLNPRIEQQNVLYNLHLVASFPDGIEVHITSLVPPS